MTSKNELEMTKQLVIHYRSEVARYQGMILGLERQLDKEKVRNKYLQEKIKELTENKLSAQRIQIEKLKEKLILLEVELEEERNLNSSFPIVEVENQPNVSLYSYFSYSILLPDENDNQIMILGDFHVVNNGNKDIKDLIICLKLKPVILAQLTGKISNPRLLEQNNNQQVTDWVFATDDWKNKIRNEGEYWIRSTLNPHLSKGGSLTFKGFEVSIDQSQFQGKVILEAYIYSSSFETPASPLNKIYLHCP